MDLKRILLVLSTRFGHITSRIYHNCDIILLYFGPNVYANGFLRIRSYITYNKKHLQRKKYNSILEIITCDPLVYTVDFPKFKCNCIGLEERISF